MLELNVYYKLQDGKIWGIVKSIDNKTGLCKVLLREGGGHRKFPRLKINVWIDTGYLTKIVYPYWVTMTDKSMTGWGMARDKINKLVIYCESYEQALIVQDNAESRDEMIYININVNKPYYNSDKYYVSRHDIEDYKSWFIPGYFKEQA